MKKILLLIAVIGIVISFSFKEYATFDECRFRVVAVWGGSPPKIEVVLVPITNEEGTSPGQYTCEIPFTPICYIVVDPCIPDGYINGDPSRPFYYDNSTKITRVRYGTYTLH